MPDKLKDKMTDRVAHLAKQMHEEGKMDREDALEDAVASVLSGVGYTLSDADDDLMEIFDDLKEGAASKLKWGKEEGGAEEGK